MFKPSAFSAEPEQPGVRVRAAGAPGRRAAGHRRGARGGAAAGAGSVYQGLGSGGGGAGAGSVYQVLGRGGAGAGAFCLSKFSRLMRDRAMYARERCVTLRAQRKACYPEGAIKNRNVALLSYTFILYPS